MNTGQIIGTIVWFIALSGLRATLLGVSIADSSLGAYTSIGSRKVLASSAGMARLFRALINIRAPEGGSNKSGGALALSSEAQLGGWTIGIGVTTRLACPVRVTDLSGQTVVAGVAHLATHLLIATFSNRTGGGLGTGQITLISDAHVSTGALIAGQAGSWHTHASLFRSGITLESLWAAALATVLGNATKGIGTTTTGRLAGIQALVLNAGLILLALLVAATPDGAVTLHAG